MRAIRIFLWLTVAALAAPALAQNELPSAPSAVKQPPAAPAPPPPSPQPAPAKNQPPPTSQPAPPTASKDAGSPPAAPAPEAASEGPQLETIVKRVDEVNVVFTVTKRMRVSVTVNHPFTSCTR